jgi:NAD(P)-dependent dehydrogenase (short-subunit alcohol dehydrogenase family)
MTYSDQPKSILVIGATGGLGLQCLRHLADHPSTPKIHAFCRSPSKLSIKDKTICTSIIQGDARKFQDINGAITAARADYVVLITGAGQDVSKTDIRQVSGEVLVEVIKQPLLQHIKVVVVSSNGAGGSKIIFGLGIGKLISYHLRHVLEDHTNQEKAFANLMDRTLIVRPTSLNDDKSGRVLVEFGDKEKGPTMDSNRSDVAAWIATEIGRKTFAAGRKVNLTSAK